MLAGGLNFFRAVFSGQKILNHCKLQPGSQLSLANLSEPVDIYYLVRELLK